MPTINVKGFRTVLAGLGLAIGPTALDYLATVDWNALVGTKLAFLISGVIMIGMRAFTTTPVGVNKEQ
jgi:hypothetical protein